MLFQTVQGWRKGDQMAHADAAAAAAAAADADVGNSWPVGGIPRHVRSTRYGIDETGGRNAHGKFCCSTGFACRACWLHPRFQTNIGRYMYVRTSQQTPPPCRSAVQSDLDEDPISGETVLRQAPQVSCRGDGKFLTDTPKAQKHVSARFRNATRRAMYGVRCSTPAPPR